MSTHGGPKGECSGVREHEGRFMSTPGPGSVPGVRGETTGLRHKVNDSAAMADAAMVRAVASPRMSMLRESAAGAA